MIGIRIRGMLFAAMVAALVCPALAARAGEGEIAPQLAPADDGVLRTLTEGEAAIAAGDYDALLLAGQFLRALGATPVEGQPDLASEWIAQARAHGVTKAGLGARGRALGPAYRRGVLAMGDSFSMQQLFLAGQPARISVAAGGSGLSVQVRDADGTTLCEKPVDGRQTDCVWMPAFTGRFDIVIQNGGTGPARFHLVVR